jgi:ABC-type nitrate/sulfonate/bicarbonate transport system substrate-binding protein
MRGKIAIGALLLVLAGQSAAAQELTKIRLAYSGTGISNYILELPRRQGIFRRNGLDAEIVYVGSGSLLLQALLAGSFDAALSQGSEAVLPKLRGVDVRIVASIANHFNHVYLTHPSITSFKQLKGKRVAVSRFGSGSHFITNLVLKEGGLDPQKDVAVLQIGNSSARMAAILAGTVEGSVMAGDFIPRAKKEGFNILADLAETRLEYPFLVLYALGSTIDRNFKTMKALVKSISESIRLFKTDRNLAKAVIKSALRIDDPETLDFIAARSARVLDEKPFPTEAGIRLVLEELSESEAKAKTAKFEDFVDLRGLRELEKEGLFR